MPVRLLDADGVVRTFTAVEHPTIEEILLLGAQASCANVKLKRTDLVQPAAKRLVEYFTRYDLTGGVP